MAINSRFTYLLILIYLLSSCQQIKQSFEETLNPKPNSTAEKPKAEEHSISSSSYTESSSSTFSYSTSTDNQPSSSIYESSEKLDDIQKQLQAKFPGKKLMLYQSLYFYDFQGGQITVQIQDPDKSENIDSYVYFNGEWQGPNPVKISGNISINSFLFPLDELKFSVAKKIHEYMVNEAKSMEGGMASEHIYFNHMTVAGFEDSHWYSSINADRKNLFIDFDIIGKEIKRR